MKPNIAILSGEISGDLIGGALATELRRLRPDIDLWGLGSGAMRDAGVELLADSANWGVMGITQALMKAPGLYFGVQPKVRRAMRERQPSVIVPIDFGAFNMPQVRFAKRSGQRVAYYFPPSAWRRTGNQGAELAKLADKILVPFDWAETVSRSRRQCRICRSPARRAHRLDDDAIRLCSAIWDGRVRAIIGLLPGSRSHEVGQLMPTLLDAARIIRATIGDAQFVVGVAPSISSETMCGYLTGHTDLRDRISEIWHEFAQEANHASGSPLRRRPMRCHRMLSVSLQLWAGLWCRRIC